MVGKPGWARGSSSWLGCLLLVATLSGREASAQEGGTPGQAGRLRPADKKAAALLEAGAARSATFRLLTETIERSDLIVWVQAGHLQHPGQLQFVAATSDRRYVRVAVRLPGLENDLLCTLAHELQHAVEIAGAPEVRDHVSLRRFYERIGRGGPAGAGVLMETAHAQRTAAKVLNELLGSR